MAELETIKRFLRPLVLNWLALKREGPDQDVDCTGLLCDACFQTTFGARHCSNCRSEATTNHRNWCISNDLCELCEEHLDMRGLCQGCDPEFYDD